VSINNGTPPSVYPYTKSCAAGPVKLEAVPASGYRFANWSGDLSGSDNPTTITMDSAKNVTANFTQITYDLTVDVAPDSSGDVSVDGDTPENYPASYEFPSGTEVTLAAIAATGYEFSNWSGDLSGSENQTTITMDSDKEIMANFTQITYTLTVDVSPNSGMVTLEPSQPAGGYVVGTEVTLTAVASEGYKFDHWGGSVVSSEDTITITMDSDKEITASFIEVAPSTSSWWWIVLDVAVVGLLVYVGVSSKSRA
jgi:uncharacterized repeat protein (TIGR02543 family)